MAPFNIKTRTAAQLGESLRRRRKSLGWSQDELAKRSGVKQANLSALENGAPGVRIATIFKVLAALTLDLSVQERQKSEPSEP